MTPYAVITGSIGAYSNLTKCFFSKAQESSPRLCTVFMMGSHRPFTYSHKRNVGPYWRTGLGWMNNDIDLYIPK